MPEEKFTPGPWVVELESRGSWYVSPEKRVEEVAIVSVLPIDDGDDGEWVHGSQTEANARLISAAPDLLKALENLLNLADMAMQDAIRDGNLYDRDTDLAEARAAIAKARGE